MIKTNYFSNLVCTPFTLGPNGLENDETIVSSAKMTLTFDVDNSSAYSTRNSNGDILFSITMSCSNLDFLKNCIGTSNSPNIYRKLSTEKDFSGINANLTNKALDETEKTIEYSITTAMESNSGTTNFRIEIPINDNNIKTYYASDSANMPLFRFTLTGKAS